MPFIPVPNTVQTELRFTSNGQQVENTLWFEFPSDPVAADMVVLDNAVFSWWNTNMRPLQSSVVQMREVKSTSHSSASGPQDAFAPGVATFGGNTPNPVPGNVTMAISFRTALRGRAFRGRNYAIGLTEDHIAGNDFVGTATSNWQSAYNALIAAATAAGWAWVVVSRFSGVDPVTKLPVPRTTGVTTPVTSVIVVDGFVDSMRRRLSGRGK